MLASNRETCPTSNPSEKAFSNKIDFGAGYRLYFGRDGEVLVILLCGGTKKRQQRDIAQAIGYWRDYKQSKKKR